MPDSSESPRPSSHVLTEALGRALHANLPQGAARIEYVVRALAQFTQSTVEVYGVSGPGRSITVSDDVDDLADALRESMYRPDAGTWFSARLSVTDAGALDADFDYDHEPAWSRPVEPIWYAQDLERFPRAPAAIPGWLQRQLSAASST